MPKLLAFCGSTRRQSFNQAILNVAVQGAEEAGAQVTVVSLADYAMPIFNQDEEAEQGIPERLTSVYWRSLGFSPVDEDTVVYTEEDAHAIGDLGGLGIGHRGCSCIHRHSIGQIPPATHNVR